MQSVIEELIRGVGYVTLRLITLGRYRSKSTDDRLPEGAIGLALLVLLAYLTYALTSR